MGEMTKYAKYDVNTESARSALDYGWLRIGQELSLSIQDRFGLSFDDHTPAVLTSQSLSQRTGASGHWDPCVPVGLMPSVRVVENDSVGTAQAADEFVTVSSIEGVVLEVGETVSIVEFKDDGEWLQREVMTSDLSKVECDYAGARFELVTKERAGLVYFGFTPKSDRNEIDTFELDELRQSVLRSI